MGVECYNLIMEFKEFVNELYGKPSIADLEGLYIWWMIVCK